MSQPSAAAHPLGREFFLSQFLVPRHLKDFKLPWRLLLDQDPAQLAAQLQAEGLLIEMDNLWTCSHSGKTRAEAFLLQQSDDLARVQSDVEGALTQRDYDRAAQTYLGFESAQPFPNDRALNPTQDSLQSLIQDLAALANSRPSLLKGGVPESVIQESARALLWGAPPSLSTESSILLSYVSNQRDLQRYREEGIARVQVLASEANDCCSQCLRFHEQFFEIQSAPELPILDCLKSPPCACLYFPDF